MTDANTPMAAASVEQPVLLPCEYCATAPVHFENAYGTGYIIHCPEDENCLVSPYVEMGAKEQSIAAWNTRAALDARGLEIKEKG